MKEQYKKALFARGFLAAEADGDTSHAEETVLSLAALFGIRIVSGAGLAQPWMIRFASGQLGMDVPEPFYRGFPQSVRTLSPDRLFLDQAVHYGMTYGLGLRQEAGHSLFESAPDRTVFGEGTEEKRFSILAWEEAVRRIEEIVSGLLSSSRPLSDEQYALVLEYAREHGIARCASRDTLIRLLADTRDRTLVRFLVLSDVIQLVEEIHYRQYGSEDPGKLSLRNRDRKFITAVIDALLAEGRCDLRTCFEKKALWSGLLHHIHYRPGDAEGIRFAACMRGKGNLSVYSEFERAMAEGTVPEAVRVLREGKGDTAVLRHLTYLLSRCSGPEESERVLDSVTDGNRIVLMQLLIRFSLPLGDGEARDFRFPVHNRMRVHHETEEEVRRRRSILADGDARRAAERIRALLKAALKDTLGRVYIDPGMKNIALPLQENTAQGGWGVLPKGSRLPIGAGKKIRAFIYWEKAHDIDLSVIGLGEDGQQTEFSWRTMCLNQSAAITFSGDETSGWNGGSEYFDIDADRFREQFPRIRTLVFCGNVFSGGSFDACLCRAGYMVRDTEDSGAVFEPKTVSSAFRINCASRFAYLFGIDLKTKELLWLNLAGYGEESIAGETSLAFLTRYFEAVSVISLYTFFEMMATERVSSPEEADLIVSDRPEDFRDRAEVIRSCDTDRILALMNA